MSTSRVHVGTPPGDFNGWTMTEVCFHGFADLSTTRDDYAESPEFLRFGHQWVLRIYPGGRANSEEGYVDLGLLNKSNTSIEIKCSFSVRDADGKEVAHCKSDKFRPVTGRYKKDFAKRSGLMNTLVNGSLVIEVRIKSANTDKSITQFIPTNPLCKNVLQKFDDEKSADVIFEVDNGSCKSEEHTNKKSKSTTTFYAHRFILQDISTMMAELCKSDEGGVTSVSIKDVKPEIFKHMINYAYGGKVSGEDLKVNAKAIINACDKYGVVHLKLEAEACYVKSSTITIDNMMDNLLYADSKNLAVLKEAVMDYIVKNKTSIIGKVSFDNVPSSMITDVLTAMAREEEQTGEEEDESAKYVRMRVGTLRKLLDEKGLDVDGSRESMIALLKENDD